MRFKAQIRRKEIMKYNRLAAVLAASALVLNMTACSKTETPAASATPEATAEAEKPAESAAPEATAETESNKAAIVGTWQLSKVLVSEKEGENPVEVQEEDHASMFEEKNSVYTFNEDGTGTVVMTEGEDKVEKELTWVTNDEGSYTVSGDADEVYLYDPVEDVLMREYIGRDPSFIHVLTVFARQ